MGGKTWDRPSSDAAGLLRMKLSPRLGLRSETRVAFGLSPVFPFSGDEPPPENVAWGRDVVGMLDRRRVRVQRLRP